MQAIRPHNLLAPNIYNYYNYNYHTKISIHYRCLPSFFPTLPQNLFSSI